VILLSVSFAVRLVGCQIERGESVCVIGKGVVVSKCCNM
jgi:hypothetical protein